MSLETVRRVLEQEAQAILHLAAALEQDSYTQAIDWIFDCKGRVVCCGIGKSGHIARKTSGTLSSTGTPSLFLHAAEAVHGDLGTITDQDIVLLYSHSGETDELVKLFPAIKSIGARTILMTGRSESSAGRLSDLILNTLVQHEACPNNLAPTTSTTVMLALSDAIAVAVMERRGFGKEDFARFHPSGTLGKRLLLRVQDVMRSGDDYAVVAPEASVLEVMQALSRTGVGATCVIDEQRHLLGLISDGDLRRHFIDSPNPLEAKAGEILTRNVSTITPDLLAVEALEVFQNLPKKIGDMPVLEDGRLVGLVLLKELLRSGIL